MLVPILLFAVGLLCLIKGGDWFVDGAVGIAKKFHLPELLIGATIVSIGTTLPEVMVSATSALTGHGEIAYGNAIGSIICNSALIAAIPIVAKPGTVNAKTFRLPVFFYFAAAVLYAAVSYASGYFNRTIGISLLLLFAVYMTVTILSMKKNPDEPSVSVPEESEEDDGGEKKLPAFLSFADPAYLAYGKFKSAHLLIFNIIDLVIGAALIAVGADLLVDNGTLIAQAAGVPESVIALTFVALGTSLPELVTAITSLIKGHSSLSLGNIVGANLFNLVLVSGLSVTLSPFAVPSGTTLFGINSSLLLDIPLAFLVMGLLTVPALTKGKLYRWQGIALLVIYAAYCSLQFLMPSLA